jgi:hypothetical protein
MIDIGALVRAAHDIHVARWTTDASAYGEPARIPQLDDPPKPDIPHRTDAWGRIYGGQP